jgi:hypothetical protein
MRFVCHESSSPLATSWAGAVAVAGALERHADLARFALETGAVESHTAMLVGMADTGPTVVSVDAKAGETFGETVRDAPQGVEDLVTAIVGPRGLADERVLDLRCHLLSATAGAIATAARQGAANAVLLIHEFASDATTDARARNAKDLHDFGMTVFNVGFPHEAPWCVGPFHVHGRDPQIPARIRLYVASATTD